MCVRARARVSVCVCVCVQDLEGLNTDLLVTNSLSPRLEGGDEEVEEEEEDLFTTDLVRRSIRRRRKGSCITKGFVGCIGS